jgi:formylmethanofuran dehydrogenase subunit C
MLRLRRLETGAIPIETDGITPDRLAALSPSEIAALQVRHGNRNEKLGEFFHVEGDPSDGEIYIEGDCSRVTRLGAGMTGGALTIDGSAGPYAGAELRNGRIEIHGDAGDWLGAEMRGGRIHLHGSAGNRAGAAYPGSLRGMRGGTILIDGRVGDELGSALRRGLIAVGGDCGDFAGAAMIAGTIVVFGSVGRRPAAGLKRGTVMTFGPPPALLPTFRFDCSYRPPIIDLYLRQLRTWGLAVPDAALSGPVRRYRGDFVALGKGEVLVWGPS